MFTNDLNKRQIISSQLPQLKLGFLKYTNKNHSPPNINKTAKIANNRTGERAQWIRALPYCSA